MSYLAGLGAAKSLFLTKLANRTVWIIDGCPIACSLGVFAQLGELIDVPIRLHDLGVRKNSPMPEKLEFKGLVAAALRQVAKRKQHRTQVISNDDDATNQTHVRKNEGRGLTENEKKQRAQAPSVLEMQVAASP